MATLYIDGPTTARRPIVLGSQVGGGLSGIVYKLVGERGTVVKLYRDTKLLAEYRDKIEAMLSAPPDLPPISDNGRNYVQIAWPTAKVIDNHGTFLGFAMPEIDTTAATELNNILNKKIRKHKSLPEFYGGRVLLAANLAALMAELHVLGHYMVDLKPLNTMFYPDAWYMAILDADGFSVGGAKRFPAHQYSDDYIAPEADGVRAEDLGLEQDLFALAVIVFNLLNNGVHPYSGVPRGGQNLPTTLQGRINANLYAYGLTPSKLAGPVPLSIHEYFEDETRRLFDLAFCSAARPRPTAREWRDHLNSLIQKGILAHCAKNPKEHAHFSKGCGLCAIETNGASLLAAASRRQSQASGTVLHSLKTASRSSSARIQRKVATSLPRSYSQPRPQTTNRIALLMVLGIAAIFFLFAIVGGNKTINSSASLPQPQSAKPGIVSNSVSSPAPSGSVSESDEIGHWNRVKSTREPSDIRGFLEKYPGGTFAALARIRLQKLEGDSAVPGGSSSLPASSAPSLSTTLSALVDRAVIREVQDRLYNLNYEITNRDGQLTGNTRDGIRKWQRNINEPVTGDISEYQLSLLRRAELPRIWGALAYYSKGATSTVWDMRGREEAEREALAACRRNAGAECNVVTVANNICATLAFYNVVIGGRQYWGAYASVQPTLRQAIDHAMSACQRQATSPSACGVRTTVCADGSHRR